MLRQSRSPILALSAILLSGSALTGQTPPASPPQPAGGRGGFGRASQRPPADPAALERGKGLYSVNCGFCHGSDARGGEGGPNLIRSTFLLNDKKGEGIAPVIRQGRPAGGMPPINLTDAQIADIATFLHSFPVGGRDAARATPPTILVGNAAAGKVYFASKCASCHSETGDLKGFATRNPDPKTLQHAWLMPGGRGGRGPAPVTKVSPVTATVTWQDGRKAEGRLERLDDFVVTLRDSEGRVRSYPRKGDHPRVEIHNPLQPHIDLLPQYTDKDIHDLTAYLVTLK